MLSIDMHNSRYYIKVRAICNSKSTEASCLIDTGAKVTSLPNYILDKLPGAKMLRDNVGRKGIAPGAVRLYSEYAFDIAIDTLLLHEVPILIPKDDEYFMPLLGMDILSRMTLRQSGGSYQMQVSSPTCKRVTMHITNSNINEALNMILSELNRAELHESILRSLPTALDLEYIDLYKLVIKFIGEKSL